MKCAVKNEKDINKVYLKEKITEEEDEDEEEFDINDVLENKIKAKESRMKKKKKKKGKSKGTEGGSAEPQFGVAGPVDYSKYKKGNQESSSSSGSVDYSGYVKSNKNQASSSSGTKSKTDVAAIWSRT